jgi:CHASE2 domain-containing sensor protein
VGTGPAVSVGTPRWRFGAALIAAAVVALLAGYGTWHSSIGNQLELRIIDARFHVRGNERPSGQVVVVGIDAPTIEALTGPLLPGAVLPRRFDARMIDRLRSDGVRTIAYDLVFDTKSASPADDLELYDAAKATRGRLILAGDATNGRGRTFVLGGVAHQRAAGVTVGSVLFPEDSNGVIDRLPERVNGLESFAAAVAVHAGVSPRRLRSLFAGGPVWIDFPGPAGALRPGVNEYSFMAVLDGAVPASRLRGKVVVIGDTAPTLQDFHTVADGGSQPMSGPELEADAIATLLEGVPLRPASSAVDWLILIAAALILPALALLRRPWPWIVAGGMAAAVAYVVASQLAFEAGTITLLTPALVALLVGGVGAVLGPLALERRELRVLRDRFARFDPAVVEAVLADPGVALRLRALALGPASVIAGYRLVALAGRGGMGVVYEAIQLSLERPVALKLIDPARADDAAFRARFIRESRVTASLAHPHVIPVYEAGEDGGLLFITMRLAAGGSLHELIAQRAPLAPALAASLGAQVASALHAAHAAGLVHRDVKPANVLLDLRSEGETPHSYLTDFGVTRGLGSDGLTAVGERIGTVDYMAPEQARGEEVGPQADLYSLGCVLFEALTASVPYPRDSEAARIAAHAGDPVPLASERWPSVPRGFDAVLARALAKDPAERFGSGLEFATALLQAAGIEPVGVVAPASKASGDRLAVGPTAAGA